MHDFDKEKFFEGCLPIEVMAHRGPRHAALRADEAGRPHRSAHRPLSVRGRAAPAGHARRRSLQPRGFSDAVEVGRAGARAADDSRARAGRVRPLRHGAPQHLHQRPDRAARHVADAPPRRSVLRRAGVGRRGLRRVGRVGSDRRAQCRRARAAAAAVGAAADDGHRRARATTCRTPTPRTYQPSNITHGIMAPLDRPAAATSCARR